MVLEVRKEVAEDIPSVYAVNQSAFGSETEEAILVDALRANADQTISLVAVDGEEVIGHIMFSPMSVEGNDIKIYGLAPMAVAPKYQNQGVGSELVKAGLKECKSLGVIAVFVLGHANFYPRFGFKPSSCFGVQSEYDVPDEVFMGLELVPGALGHINGIVRYSQEFSAL